MQKCDRAEPWTSIQGSGSQSDLDLESMLFLKPCFLIQLGKTLYGDKVAYLWEHPEDPELLDKSWLSPEERKVPCPSVWATSFIKDFREEVGGSLQAFDQGPLGGNARKLAKVLTDLPLNLDGIQGQPQGPRTAVSNSSKLARWAPGMRQSVSNAIEMHLKQIIKIAAGRRCTSKKAPVSAASSGENNPSVSVPQSDSPEPVVLEMPGAIEEQQVQQESQI